MRWLLPLLVVLLLVVGAGGWATPIPDPLAGFGRSAVFLDREEITGVRDADRLVTLGDYQYACGDLGSPGGNLTRARRCILSFRQELCLVVDDLVAARPGHWEWVMSSPGEPEVDSKRNRVLLWTASKQLEVIFPLLRLSPIEDPNPEKTPKEWRLGVSPNAASASQRFVAVLRRSPRDAQGGSAIALSGDGWAGAKYTGEEVLIGAFRLASPEEGYISAGRIESDGEAIAAHYLPGNGDFLSVFMVRGRFANLDGKLAISADNPTNVLLSYKPKGIEVLAALSRPGAVWVRTAAKPKSIRDASGKSVRWRYDPESHLTALYLPAGPAKVTAGW